MGPVALADRVGVGVGGGVTVLLMDGDVVSVVFGSDQEADGVSTKVAVGVGRGVRLGVRV